MRSRRITLQNHLSRWFGCIKTFTGEDEGLGYGYHQFLYRLAFYLKFGWHFISNFVMVNVCRKRDNTEHLWSKTQVIMEVHSYIAGLWQDCSHSIANALGLLQSCTKPSIYCISCSTNRGRSVDPLDAPAWNNPNARNSCFSCRLPFNWYGEILLDLAWFILCFMYHIHGKL